MSHGPFVCLPMILALLPISVGQVARDVEVVGVATHQARRHGGIFVGVNRFRDHQIRELRFAIDDAIELAWMFVVELELLKPGETFLLLGGDARGTPAKDHLAALRKRGVHVGGASKADILDAISKVSQERREKEDLLIVSVSSHGVQDSGGEVFLLPEDGLSRFPKDTGVPMKLLASELASSLAGKRLLLLDACRKDAMKGDKSLSDGGAGEFRRILSESEGQAVLFSCSEKQRSYEDDKLGHGVFTHYVLKALRGAAPADDAGLVRLGSVMRWVSDQVAAHTRNDQLPWYSGSEASRSIPLALNRKRGEAISRFSSDVAEVRQALTRKIEVDGAFNATEFQLALQLLALAKPGPRGDSLLQRSRDFVEGRVSEDLYVPYIRSLVPDPTPVHEGPSPPVTPGRKRREVPWATVVRADPDPSVVSAAALRERISETGYPWRVRDTQSGIELVLIPPGQYDRGASPQDADAEDDEKPRHRVRLTKPFYLGVVEVTNAQFKRFHEGHDSGELREFSFNGNDQPVVNVSWNEAREFCARSGFRLPTENEWEYACRGGTTTRYPWGEEAHEGKGWANVFNPSVNTTFSWNWDTFPFEDGFTVTAPVGQFTANGFGLKDMIGNVWEWCSDVYDANEYQRHVRGVTDPTGPLPAGSRALRGGSWCFAPRLCRASNRDVGEASSRHNVVGFRVAKALAFP